VRPIIALTCSSGRVPPDPALMRDFANQAYSEALRRAGGAPVLVPPADEPEAIDAVLACARGLVITGGVDIAPEAYGEVRQACCGEVHPLRDDLDRRLLAAADRLGLPVLGICRGMQAMAAFAGGALYQDILTEMPTALEHRPAAPRATKTHTVHVDPDSLLASVVGAGELGVNSFHHQAVRNVPPGLRVTARAPDGVIEALEAPGPRFRLGVQWHPEDLAGADRRHAALFEALVAAARTGG